MSVYTLFGQSLTAAVTSDASAYTMGVQFSVSQAATLNAVWFYSASSANSLPTTIALYGVSGASLITSQAAAWSGAAGSGWIRAPFTVPPSLTPGVSYKACIFLAGSTSLQYASVSHYWDTGAGSAGISSGPLSAPANAGGDHGQDTFHQSAALTYPDTSFNATNYLVDAEITSTATAGGGLGFDPVTDFILEDR